MIRIMYLLIIAITLLSCSGGILRVAGTSTEVSNGSITGFISTTGSQVSTDTFEVELIDLTERTRATSVKTMIVDDGTYRFDSLSGGYYRVMIFHNEQQIASRDSIGITKKKKDVIANFSIGSSSEIVNAPSGISIDDWSVHESNGGSGVVSKSNDELRIDVKVPGADYGAVSVRRSVPILEKGKVYELSFDAYSGSFQEVQVIIMQSAMPHNWTGWSGSNGVVSVDAIKKTYKSSFLVTSSSSSDLNLMFNCGGGSGQSELFIDNISLKLIADTDQLPIDDSQTVLGENMLQSSEVSGDPVHWYHDNKIDVEIVDGEYDISVIGTQDNPWDMQFLQQNLYLAEGYKYQISFDAYALEERELRIAITGAQFPWTYYAWFGEETSINITKNKKRYEFTFTMDNLTNTNSQFTFYCGSHSSDLFLDNIELKLIKK